LLSKSKLARPWYRANDTAVRNEMARKAFEAVLTVTLRKPDSAEYRKFSDNVKARAQREYNETIGGDEEVESIVIINKSRNLTPPAGARKLFSASIGPFIPSLAISRSNGRPT